MRGVISRFPATFTHLGTPVLLRAYEAGPRRLRQALTGLSREDLRAKPEPAVWCIQEVVMHVADSELNGAARIRLVRAQPGSSFYSYDQDVWAHVFRYRDADEHAVEAAIDLFEALRVTTLPLFASATDADWHATGIHPEHGTVTLRNLLELYADHSERHIAQIVQRRGRLGHPIILPPLLPERLY